MMLPLIEPDVIERVLQAALRTGGDFAEVFAEDERSTAAVLDGGRVEQVTSGRDRGVGIRVLVRDTAGFAHTTDLTESGLRVAADVAAEVARSGVRCARPVPLAAHSLERPVGPMAVNVSHEDVPKATKTALLTAADDAGRGAARAISQVMACYNDSRRRILVANSEGLLTEDEQVRTLFSVACVAVGDDGIETGNESVGHTVGFEMFDGYDVAELARRAACQAVTKLGARPAPTGSLPVVIGRGGGGVLFHEACGHGLEADLVAKGASVFRNLKGSRVVSPLITLVDDATLTGEWGTFAIDDEGTPAQRTVLFEDGVLTAYLYNWLRARRDGYSPSGNGRRQSYQHLPLVRMTNTVVVGGQTDPADIIADTVFGVYVAQLDAGEVNTATGDFVFGMTEAYAIERGKITEPLRGGNIVGNSLEVLSRIDALGNDFAMGTPATCEKEAQTVPVGYGVPTLRAMSMTIGGTAD